MEPAYLHMVVALGGSADFFMLLTSRINPGIHARVHCILSENPALLDWILVSCREIEV